MTRLSSLAIPGLATVLSLGVFAGLTAVGPAPVSGQGDPVREARAQAPAAAASLDADSVWVEATLARLPLRRKIAQMVMPWMSAEYLAVDSDRFRELRKAVEAEGVGGVITSVGGPMEVASNLALLQRHSDVPLLVAADLEYGAGRILDGGVVHPFNVAVGSATKFPPPMAFGATGEPELAYEMGRITAVEARAVGIHMAFAPVVDVNNNPQ
ncbi:MAG: glycoside hydrolase family 3 N-terminal domain-containing protein, partial [Gemmatimonadota bacterium]